MKESTATLHRVFCNNDQKQTLLLWFQDAVENDRGGLDIPLNRQQAFQLSRDHGLTAREITVF